MIPTKYCFIQGVRAEGSCDISVLVAVRNESLGADALTSTVWFVGPNYVFWIF